MNYFTKVFSKLKENKGLVLVELMVTVQIIAILSAMTIVPTSLNDGKDSTATSEARSLYMVAVVAHDRYYLMGSGTMPETTEIMNEAGIQDHTMATIYGLDKDADANAVIGVIYESKSGNFVVIANGISQICEDLATAEAVLVAAGIDVN